MKPPCEKPGGLTKFLPTDREECGVLVKNDEGFVYILRVQNHASHPEDYFIALEDVTRISEVLSDGEEIIGFFHTHLKHHKVLPTKQDLEGAKIHPEYWNLIYKPDTKEMHWYRNGGRN